MKQKFSDASLSEVHGSVDTTKAGKPGWRRILSFFGPAYLVSVGYMDPGNWATDLAGGSQFGDEQNSADRWRTDDPPQRGGDCA